MKKNIGNVDRLLRFIVGAGLLSLTFVGPQSLLGLIGLIPLLTSMVGFCPLYKILGLNTCPLSE